MNATQAVSRGGELEASGDLVGAEIAYREADDMGDAEGAVLLGQLLRRRGLTDEALAILTRAEQRGHREAASCIGSLLWDQGRLDAAKQAFARGVAVGSTDAAVNLGLLHGHLGEHLEGLSVLTPAYSAGDPVAAWAVGRIMEEQGDLPAAVEAYRRAASGGDRAGAFSLASVLLNLNDQVGARAALELARNLGHPEAPSILEAMDRERDGRRLAMAYADACARVMSTIEPCIEKANQAMGAMGAAERRPQHEMSIATFQRMADGYSAELCALYATFAQACAEARATATELLASQPSEDAANRRLVAAVDQTALRTIATAKCVLLSSSYGPAPQQFVRGLGQTNELIDDPPPGFIYAPQDVASSADETICPWCAETIKLAAVICRFCGRDLPRQSEMR